MKRRFWFWVPLGVVLAGVGLMVGPVVPAVNDWLTGEWQQPVGEVLIVLSAEQLGDGTIGVSSYWRSVYAVRAWRGGHWDRIVVSGGRLAGPGHASVAAEMSDFLVSQGVPREVILVEDQSHSTRENALKTAALIAGMAGRKVLLTSDCHMRRARRVFQRVGVEVIPAPVPDVGKRWNTWTERPGCAWMVAVELAKFGYYRRQGWI